MDDEKRALVEDNLKLARKVAATYEPFGHLMTLDDLLQEACLGLIAAAESYDPSKGKFSTFAYQACRWRCSRALQTSDRAIVVPQPMVIAANRRRKLKEELGREPTAEEVGVTDDELALLLQPQVQHQVAWSLDAPVGGEEGSSTYGDLLAEAESVYPDPAELVDEAAFRDWISTCLDGSEATFYKLHAEEGRSIVAAYDAVWPAENVTRQSKQNAWHRLRCRLAHPISMMRAVDAEVGQLA
jgi:RNA polymerase sigma factor (sigma-70 family)